MCTRQDLQSTETTWKKNSYVAHMLDVYQVYYGVDCCFKWELFFTKYGAKTNRQHCLGM